MHDFSENEFLTDLLKSAAKAGINELYLFSVNDRLFVTYMQEGAAPRIEVFKGAGGVLRTLRGTMESDVSPGSETAHEQEWCLDLGKAHFDMSTGEMVLVRIISPRAAGDETRKSVPPPPDEELVLDEDALAAALVTEPEELGETQKPPPPPPPQDDEQVLDEDALAAALVTEPEDLDETPKPSPPPPPPDEERSIDEVLAAVLEQDHAVPDTTPKPPPPPPPPDEERSIDDALAAVLEPEPEPPMPPPTRERRDAPPPPSPLPPAEKTPAEKAREMVGAILLGNKPFPSQAVKAIPIQLSVQGRFVPIWYEGEKLWVAVSGQSSVRSLLSQDVETIEVDTHKLQDLLTCYRIDPRHKKR